MLVRAFGNLTIEVESGQRRAIAAPRPRLVLAALAARHDSFVSEEALIETIWNDDPPRSARTALQTYVSALRDELEPGRPRRSPGRCIEHSDGAYRLRLPAEDFDLAAFETDLTDARACHTDDRDRSVRLLDAALGLWDDPPLGECASETWALGTVVRLRDLHAGALESRFGMALEDGTEGEVLALMEAAVASYPYRERLAGQLMLSLHRGGKQRRALERYAETRRILRDDLGLDPGRELQLLQRAILDQDPALRRRTPSSLPGRASSRSASSRTERPRRLIGRDRELATVRAAIHSERCVTVVGRGGVGKSALVAAVVDELRRTGATVHHVDLAEHAGRDAMRSIAAALRVVEHPLVPLAASVGDALAGDDTVLVVETCELALDEVAQAVDVLLASAGLHILLTSQMPTRASLEHVIRLGGLAPADAIQVLARGASFPAEQHADLEAIAERLEGLPLTLELAAAPLRALGPAEFLRVLAAEDDVLTSGTGRPDRQRSTADTVARSVGLLDDEQLEVIELVAAFEVRWTLAAARRLDGGRHDVGRIVAELVDRSLVERVDGDPPRFWLPSDVRRGLLVRGGGRVDAARTEVAELVFGLAANELRRDSAREGLALADLDGEILPALDRFAELDDQRQLVLAGMLGSYYQERGLISEGRERLARAIAEHRDAPDGIIALAAAQAGFLAWYQGDLHGAMRSIGAIESRLDGLSIPGFAESVRGCAAFARHDFAEAAVQLGAAADLVPGATKQHLLLLNMAGNAAWYAGEPDAAARRYREQGVVARRAGDRFHLAQSLRFSALVAVQEGREDDAMRWSEQSRRLTDAMADPVGRAQSAAACAVVALGLDERDEAVRHAAAAVEAGRRHVDVFALRAALPILVDAATAADAVAATCWWGWYTELLERTGQTATPATALLADEVVERLRTILGRRRFASECARGALLELGELLDDIERFCGAPTAV